MIIRTMKRMGHVMFSHNVYIFFSILMIICMSNVLCHGDENRVIQPKSATDFVKSVYKIGYGDQLEISVWKEPDISRADVLVRIDGKITFPLLGDIQAAGLTTMQLKYDIEAGLKSFISSPVVTVTVRNPVSQRFYILGEVANSGEYQLVKGLTILQALALAGGFTEWASKNEIILFRHEEGRKRIIKVKYKNIIKGKDFSQNVFLKANDTIIVP